MTSGRPYLFRKKILIQTLPHQPKFDGMHQQSNFRPVVYPANLLPPDSPTRVETQPERVRIPYIPVKPGRCCK